MYVCGLLQVENGSWSVTEEIMSPQHFFESSRIFELAEISRIYVYEHTMFFV